MDLEKAILARIRSKGCVKIVAVIPPNDPQINHFIFLFQSLNNNRN